MRWILTHEQVVYNAILYMNNHIPIGNSTGTSEPTAMSAASYCIPLCMQVVDCAPLFQEVLTPHNNKLKMQKTMKLVMDHEDVDKTQHVTFHLCYKGVFAKPCPQRGVYVNRLMGRFQ